MSSKSETNGKVSRVRPIQRPNITRPLTSSISRSSQDSTRSKQSTITSEHLQQIRELETQVSTLQRKNVDLQREMQEALGLQQLKAKTVEALHKDLNSKSDVERKLNEFLLIIGSDGLEQTADEIKNLRKKCQRSEEYLSELNDKYREASLRNQKLEEAVAELRAEIAVHGKGGKPSGAAGGDESELKKLHKKCVELEQKSECVVELKQKIISIEIEKRDLKAENTHLKGKVTALQRDRKQLQDKVVSVESEANQRVKELKDAQVRHLEMLSKLRRSHTKLDARYKHLLKERAQWQSLFRTANGELSKSTESLASISSVASSSVSRASFFRDSSNLEEYNIHLESELVAVQESLRIAEKDKDRFEKKLRTLSDQVIEDENLIAELDQNRAKLIEERDTLQTKCSSLDDQVVVLQKSLDELREQLDMALFENNEMSLRGEDQLHAGDANTLISSEEYDSLKKELVLKDEEIKRHNDSIEEYVRQIEVLKNNAESLAKDLSVEVREKSNTELMKLQDEVNARDAKLKDYEKMQKVLKKALVENETLKDNKDLLQAKISAVEARVIELESQLKAEQHLLTESNGKLTQQLRLAEQENERLQGEFSKFDAQISELSQSKCALEAIQSEKDLLRSEASKLSATVKDAESQAEALKMTLTEKAKQIAGLIQDLETSRSENAKLETSLAEQREMFQKLSIEKESKMATLADEIKTANSELEVLLSEKAHKIEQLEQQILAMSEKERTDDHNKKTMKTSIESFVGALKLDVNPGLHLDELLPQTLDRVQTIFQNNVHQISENEKQISSMQAKLAESASFAQTIAQLNEQLKKDEAGIRRYEEILANQNESIQNMRVERENLERSMEEFHERDSNTINRLETLNAELTGKLNLLEVSMENIPHLRNQLDNLETQCADKQTVIDDLHDQLTNKKNDLKSIQEKLKEFDIMGQQISELNAALDKTQNDVKSLRKEVEDKEQKLRGKNQVIQELETELSEKMATFDEMEKVFRLKGEEYKKVRETLSSNEEEIAKLSTDLAVAESVITSIVQRLMPKENSETWNTYSDKVIQAIDSLLESVEQIEPLKEKLENTIQESVTKENTLKASEKLITQINSELNTTKTDLSQIREAFELSKTENDNLKQNLNEQDTENLEEISNLRKLLAESESIINGLSEQRNVELENLMVKIQTLSKIKEDLERKLHDTEEEKTINQSELNSKIAEFDERLASISSENEKLKQDIEKVTADLEKNRKLSAEKSTELEELTRVLAEKQSHMSRFEEKVHALMNKYVAKIQAQTSSLESQQAENASLKQNIEVLEQDLDKAQNEQKCLIAEISELKTRESEMESSLRDKCESLDSIRMEMESIEQKMRDAWSQYEETERKLTEREAEVSRLMDDLAIARTSLSEKTEDVVSYHDHVKAFAEEKVRLEEETKLLRKKIDDNSEEYQGEALEMQQELSIMTERYNIKCREYESLSKEVATKAADVEALTVKLVQAEAAKTQIISEVESKLQQEFQQRDLAFKTARQLEEQINQLKTHLDEKIQKEKACTSRISELETEILQKEDLSKQSLESLKRELEDRAEVHRKEMEEKYSTISSLKEEKTLLETSNSMEIEKLTRKFEDELERAKENYNERLRKSNESRELIEKEIHQIRENLINQMSKHETFKIQLAQENEQALKAARAEFEQERARLVGIFQTEKVALESELKKLQGAYTESTEALSDAKSIISELVAAKSVISDQLRQQTTLSNEVEDIRSANEFLTAQIASIQQQANAESKLLQQQKTDLEKEKTLCDQKLLEASNSCDQLCAKLSGVRSELEANQRIMNQVLDTLCVDSPERIVPRLEEQKVAMSLLGRGVLKIRSELTGHANELESLRNHISSQTNELSAFILDLMHKLASRQQQMPPNDNLKSLVDSCLEVLRHHNVQSLSAIQNQNVRGEAESVLEQLDTLDVHFQTFNGPTAQFVAEQQASSTAMMKKLAAAMQQDDTAPEHLHNTNGESTVTVKVDPFETIKQQKILIHELMAKLEMTKKILDGEQIRRKELDDKFKTWSTTDKRIHDAQVSFSISQLSQRDDTFDCAPMLESQKQLIPEKSLHVTRQFPTYVESFIRWLVNSTPQTYDSTPPHSHPQV